MNWQHPDDPIALRRHKSQKCAELLVPHSVDPKYLTGAYVVSREVAVQISRTFALPIITRSSNVFPLSTDNYV